MIFLPSKKSLILAALIAAGSVSGLHAQVTANDDGSAGSPFATTDEESEIAAGASVTANDTGTFDVLTPLVRSVNGVFVGIDGAGVFSYDPRENGEAQALGAAQTLEDTFEYGIIEQASPTAGFVSELNPTAAVNDVVWGALPATVSADAGAPSSFLTVYDFSGTTGNATRAAFTDNGYNTADVSLEFWIKQDTLENCTLWETGGSGTGSGVFLTDTGVIKWVIKHNGQQILDSTSTMTAGSWHHIVLNFEIDQSGTNDLMEIYLDGVSVGTDSSRTNLGNWSGGNAAGLGGVNSDAGGDDANPGNLIALRNPFNGQLGLFRFYSGAALTGPEVTANYDAATAPSDTATVTIGVTGANDAPSAVNDDLDASIAEFDTYNSTVDLTANDGLPGDNLVLNYDARFSAGTGTWENRGSLFQNDATDWIFGSGVTLNSSVASTHSRITAAYEWDGTVNATGTWLAADGGNSIHNILAGQDTRPTTLEAWIKLDAVDLTQISTIFETGGGSGVGLVVDNGVLKGATELDGAAGNESTVSYDLVGDTLGVLGGVPTTDEFFQVALAIVPNGGLTLFVNGVQVDQSDSGVSGDFDGGDGAGLGRFGQDNHGGFVNGAATTAYNTYFNGAMAAFRLYDEALNEVGVRQAYEAVSNDTDIDGDAVSVAGVIDGNGTLIPVGSPAITASGATVTVTSASGAFTYAPNGALGLGVGQTVRDTFTYRLTDGSLTDDAQVSILVTGTSAIANDDALAVVEGTVTNFLPNALIGNDELGPIAADPAYNLSPGAIQPWVSWPDQGFLGLNAAPGGAQQGAPVVQTGFGGIGRTVSSATSNTLDPISADDATVEVWFRPDPGLAGSYTVFETGGNGNGTSVVYNANTGEATVTIDGGDDTTQIIQATVSGVSTTEFNQLIFTYDKDGGAEVAPPSGIFEDLLSVYLNNDPAAGFDPAVDGSGFNANGTADDWAGTDGIGINTVNGTSAINENWPGMPGEAAAVRAYDRILSSAEMQANFDAFVKPVASVSSPTGLGATVTLNGDGSVTLDYSGVTGIGAGGSATDSFTYTTSDLDGGTTMATVQVTVLGTAPNQQPAGADLTQSILFDSANVPFVPAPTVNDPDLFSEISPVYSVTGTGQTVIDTPAVNASGLAARVEFTPTAADVQAGNRRVVHEIGGTSNGQGLYLIDGVPHFIAKANGNNTQESANGYALDNDWNGDNVVTVPLSGVALTAGVSVVIETFFQIDSLQYEIDGGGAATQAFVNMGTRSNIAGDNTLGIGAPLNFRGALAETGTLFFHSDFLPLGGTVESATFSVTEPELLTATLTVDVAEGALSAPAGSSYDGGTGVWTATGTAGQINALLAAVEFLPNGASPVDVDIVIVDGGENGTVAVSGTTTFELSILGQWRVANSIPFDGSAPGADTDGLDEIFEFAFGTDPNANDNNPLTVTDGANFTPGTQVIQVTPPFSPATVTGRFVRRKDFAAAGLTYVPEFSADLVTWETDPANPAPSLVSTMAGDYEVVEVPYLVFLSNGQKASYFRMRVNTSAGAPTP